MTSFYVDPDEGWNNLEMDQDWLLHQFSSRTAHLPHGFLEAHELGPRMQAGGWFYVDGNLGRWHGGMKQLILDSYNGAQPVPHHATGERVGQLMFRVELETEAGIYEREHIGTLGYALDIADTRSYTGYHRLLPDPDDDESEYEYVSFLFQQFPERTG